MEERATVGTAKAVKEWSAVVEALGQGKQAVLLRKYAPARRDFLLYPTYEFARRKKYLDTFQPEYRTLAKGAVEAKKPKLTEIKYLASIVQVIRVEKADLPSLAKLTGLYIWTVEHVEKYFSQAEEAFVWILKVERLGLPVSVKDLGRGAITYANLPQTISIEPRFAVLSDDALATIESQIRQGIKVRIEKPPETEVKETPEMSHNRLRDMIQEIGVRENRIAETEYPIDGYRLDVIWKRIAAGTPSHVFEVQIGGNLELALTKLKHAWDKWNSFPYLVTTDEDAPRAQSLLEGSFHEMGHIARVVDWKDVTRLYDLLGEASTLKSKIGL